LFQSYLSFVSLKSRHPENCKGSVGPSRLRVWEEKHKNNVPIMNTNEGAGMMAYRWCCTLKKDRAFQNCNDDNRRLVCPTVVEINIGTIVKGLKKGVTLQGSHGFVPLLSRKILW